MTPRDGFPNAFGLGLSGWGFRAGAFGPPKACGRGPWLAMPGIATPRAPGRKPQPGAWGEAVSRGHYQRSLV